MPNKDNLRKWVAELRSGKYKQGRYHLHNADDSLCCMGVACITAELNGIKLNKCADRDDCIRYDGEVHYMPATVLAWLGIHDHYLKSQDAYLDKLNDYEKLSFDEIADAIVAEYDL